jgi:hypothetical protein
MAACLAPDRQVSEQLRGYLSPGGSCIGLDYTQLGRDVKLHKTCIIKLSRRRSPYVAPNAKLR